MNNDQDWRTEYYKGMNVYVSAIPKDDSHRVWDYTIRISDPGTDSSAESELFAQSGDDDDYASEEAAVEAGFVKGYAMVDDLVK
jgi:hypothetical protein